MSPIRTDTLMLAVAALLLAGCAASARETFATDATLPLGQRLAALEARCAVLASAERQAHGVDEVARLPEVCARLGGMVRGQIAPREPGRSSQFGEALDECVSIAKHRGAIFTYRGHPGAPETYRRTRAVCDAYADAFHGAVLPRAAAR